MNLNDLNHPALTLPTELDGFRVEIDAARAAGRHHPRPAAAATSSA